MTQYRPLVFKAHYLFQTKTLPEESIHVQETYGTVAATYKAGAGLPQGVLIELNSRRKEEELEKL